MARKPVCGFRPVQAPLLLLTLLRIGLSRSDFAVVRKSVGAGGHDAIAQLQSFHDLNSVLVMDSNLHVLLMRVAIAADDHHGSGSVLRGKQGRRWNRDRV